MDIQKMTNEELVDNLEAVVFDRGLEFYNNYARYLKLIPEQEVYRAELLWRLNKGGK